MNGALEEMGDVHSNFENRGREGTVVEVIKMGKRVWSRDLKCQEENVNSSQTFLGSPQKYYQGTEFLLLSDRSLRALLLLLLMEGVTPNI